MARQRVQTVDHASRDTGLEASPGDTDAQRQQVLADEHRNVGLRRCHGYLRPGTRIQNVVGFPAERVAGHVREGEETGSRAPLARRAAARVSAVSPDWLMATVRLPGATSGSAYRISCAYSNVGRDAQQPAEDLTADETCVVGRTAGRHPDPSRGLKGNHRRSQRPPATPSRRHRDDRQASRQLRPAARGSP